MIQLRPIANILMFPNLIILLLACLKPLLMGTLFFPTQYSRPLYYHRKCALAILVH